MKKNKIICMIIILIVLIIITIIGIKELLQKDNTMENNQIKRYSLPVEETEEESAILVDNNIKKASIRSEFYIIKSCIKELYTYSNVQKLYNILDKEYIQYKGITLQNVESKIPEIYKNATNSIRVYVNDMYTIQKDTRLKIFIVDGVVYDNNNHRQNFSTIVNIDMLNKTYSVLLSDYISEKIGKIDENLKISYEFHNIEKNDYNTFKYLAIDDETYIKDLYEDYKFNMQYNIQKIYNQLDTEYRKIRFSNTESFKKFVQLNKDIIENLQIVKYSKTLKNGVTQYMCLDKNGRYMYINEKSPTEYTYILDNHTIDTEDFKQKYDLEDSRGKAKMNSDKIFDAIKTFNYEYIYNKLDENFKRNNYSNLEKLENYFKTYFYTNNIIEYNSYEQNSNLHIYKATIKDKDNEKNKEHNITIIIQLQENRNFVMSFSMQ